MNATVMTPSGRRATGRVIEWLSPAEAIIATPSGSRATGTLTPARRE